MRRAGIVLTIFLLNVVGCSSSVKDGPPVEDGAVVGRLVTQMSDASRNPAYFKDFFSADAAPPEAERTRYSKLYYKPVGAAAMKDNLATIRVAVHNDESSTPLGQVEWTFVKEGDKWKAKSAPLP